MLRAFIAMSETLNIQRTANQLGATRQTVRRHLAQLEVIMGGPLFTLEQKTYQITDLGSASLLGAKSLLRYADRWTQYRADDTHSSPFLDYRTINDDEGRTFISHQHPISQISEKGIPLLQETLSAWAASSAMLEDPAFAEVRPYLVLYKWSERGWVCVEIGEKSANTRWFGWAWAKSAVGHLLEEDHAGEAINKLIEEAYDRIYHEGGVRLDHLFAHLHREGSSPPVPVTFQRLLMGCLFPDGTPALAVLVAITRNVTITGFDPKETASLEATYLMDDECTASRGSN